jgi:penicillin-binding protein 2
MIGRTGIEKTYEWALRGKRGCKYVVVDVYNRPAGELNEGNFDTLAVSGADIITSLDIELQNYGELLMAGKRGAIVAIEPSTGEILALISAPAYDPNLLVGSQKSRNFNILSASGADPINNRALKGFYPPGSTFKPLMALIALQDSIITPNFYYACNGGYRMGRRVLGCHSHVSASNVRIGIANSCNAYFCAIFDRFINNDLYQSPAEGFEHWRDYMLKFGLGAKLNIDLPNEFGGKIPTTEEYDKAYGKGRWKASNIISLGIGQDKLIITPLQLANFMAITANKGRFYTPHVVKAIAGSDSLLDGFKMQYITPVDRKHFDLVSEGLADVIRSGTGRIAAIPDIVVCGKTGTVENPHGKDHSVFVAYAPQDNPQIAIAVIVENSGFGSQWAAPISGLMIEKYLKREISESKKWIEKRMLEKEKVAALETPAD